MAAALTGTAAAAAVGFPAADELLVEASERDVEVFLRSRILSAGVGRCAPVAQNLGFCGAAAQSHTTILVCGAADFITIAGWRQKGFANTPNKSPVSHDLSRLSESSAAACVDNVRARLQGGGCDAAAAHDAREHYEYPPRLEIATSTVIGFSARCTKIVITRP